MDISNGEGIGVSLFVQGCHFHCKGCCNTKTWDFNGGKEWTKEIENDFLDLINKPYVKRISVLGGEPLAYENIDDVLKLLIKIKANYPNKKIWLYTGYKIEEIGFCRAMHDFVKGNRSFQEALDNEEKNLIRQMIISQCDVLVDGQFEEDKKDLALKFRGSSNQRVIDVQLSNRINYVKAVYCLTKYCVVTVK